MKKHYQYNNINLLNGDCMDIMKTFPDKYFDLAIVDPPYGIGADNPSVKPNSVKQKNGNILPVKQSIYGKKKWDSTIPDDKYFIELKRVSKHQIIFGVNYYKYDLSGGRLVWNKMNGDSDQFGCEIAYCSINNRTDIVHYLWQGMFQGVYCGTNMVKAMKQQGNKYLNEKRIHPTQKPVALYKWILNKYANNGDKILDTHLGSGSSAIASHDGNFKFIGIELDSEYFEKAVQRLSNHQKQTRLLL